MSARTPSRPIATCSLSFCDSAVMCRESLRKDYVLNRSMFCLSKHSWTTWSEKESLHPAHEIIGLRACTHSSDMFRRKSRPVCFSVKKSSRSRSGDMLAPQSPTFPKKSWLRSWRSQTSEHQTVEEMRFC